MKLLLFLAAMSGMNGQTAAPCNPITCPSVTASISDQGADVIRQATGHTTKTATLVAVRACNETAEDVNVSVSRIYRQIENGGQKPTLYTSDVIAALLDVFQQRDVYNRLFKAGSAATQVIAILTTAFKVISPQLATALLVAGPVYQAILPVIHDPRDLRDLAKQIMQENTTMVLSKYDCHTGLVIARVPSINHEVVTIQ
jgi:hypothetical protein